MAYYKPKKPRGGSQVEREGRDLDRMQRKQKTWNDIVRGKKKKKRAGLFGLAARQAARIVGDAQRGYGLRSPGGR